jgi:urease beta subunit
MKKQTKARPAAGTKARRAPKTPGHGPAKNLQPAAVVPGEVILGTGDIAALAGRPTAELTVSNHGDRPIQVGSHCHFFEVNAALRFDREKAFGFRLRVPAGTAVRFEPGEEKRVTLVAIGGNRVVYGINGLVNGRLDDPQVKAKSLSKAVELGFIAKGKG